MKKALVTFAVGGYLELLDIVRPTFQDYAARHGYEYIEERPPADAWPRPPAWFRIPLLQKHLPHYEAILCLGADMIIVDGSIDIASQVPGEAIHALVAHNAPVGYVPSTEMWYLRPAMFPWLAAAWELTQYMHHPWWEQAAVNHLLGYDPSHFPMQRVRDSALFDVTHFLPLEWHSHESLDRSPRPRMVEATHGTLAWRRDVLRHYRAQVVL